MIELTQSEVDDVSGEVVPIIVGYVIVFGIGVVTTIAGNYAYDSMGGREGIGATLDNWGQSIGNWAQSMPPELWSNY
ncbi:MAG: hypothetical protein LBF16_13960 [Pseudomonadales bacterium]|jgi:hypothetical protein|nr:hypothetical protein [Pseudomonadales bacterium]